MRLDHIAYRVKDRRTAVGFFMDAFGYKEQAVFDIELEDGSRAECMALEPPEKRNGCMFTMDFSPDLSYHMAPEIFVSDGPPGGLIYNWVEQWCPGRAGGIHHLAYEVGNVQDTMREWVEKGFLFTTKDPLECDDLNQCFTQPNPFTGIIYEFIERKGLHGFCKDNVAKLMNSTAHLSEDAR